MAHQIVFLCALVLVAGVGQSPVVALGAGVLFGWWGRHPWPRQARQASKILLQASVVGLGFGMDVGRVVEVGRAGIGYTAVGIVLTLGLGWLLGRQLKVSETTTLLISTGTAICGGSAIAAIAPILGAKEEDVSVSLGTVFLLNALGLILFPVVGGWVGLDQATFGLWTALAVHDTSSVVGATLRYGQEAVAVGTTVKLARALWILPLAFGIALWKGSSKRLSWPWFILFFLLASALTSYTTSAVYPWLVRAGRAGLLASLFLIGSGLTRQAIRQVGPRPLLLGTLLWILVASLSLLFVASFGAT
jgi:uncharacterized integral membrane protein (TIGR00698 family)